MSRADNSTDDAIFIDLSVVGSSSAESEKHRFSGTKSAANFTTDTDDRPSAKRLRMSDGGGACVIDVGELGSDSNAPDVQNSAKVTSKQMDSNDGNSDTDVTQHDDEDAVTKISTSPTNDGEMSVIGASWLLNALAADDLQSLASSIGVSLRGLYTEERPRSMGPTLARSESGRHHVSAERLRQEIRQSLSADSAPDVVEWLRRYLTNLKSGNVTLLGGKVAKLDGSGCEIISEFDDGDDVVDLSSFENSAPIDVDNYAPVQHRRRKHDTDVVMIHPRAYEYDDEVRETFSLDNKTAECSICYGEVPRREIINLCRSGVHRACRLCTLQHVRTELTPAATAINCPYCVDAFRSAATTPANAPIPSTAAIPPQVILAIQKWSQAADPSALNGVRPLSDAEVSRFTGLMVDAALLSSTGERTIKCPNPSCGVPTITDSTKAFCAPCPHCRTEMCGACGVRWKESMHEGSTCDQVAAQLRIEEEMKLMEDGTAASFKRCPSCGTGVTHYRAHGCHHITCAHCKAHWCYVCCGVHPCKSGCSAWCDDTCDCVDCPDCKRSRPCVNCSRMGCMPCKGESAKAKNARNARMAVAQKTKIAGGWCGPSRNRPAHLKPSQYKAGVAVAPAIGAVQHPGLLPQFGAAIMANLHQIMAQRRR